jgi:hypothetical protein
MTDSMKKNDQQKQRPAIAMLACTVFLGAVLLFSMEPFWSTVNALLLRYNSYVAQLSHVLSGHTIA